MSGVEYTGVSLSGGLSAGHPSSGIGGAGSRVGVSDSEPEIKKKLARDPDLFLVAEVDDRLVGTSSEVSTAAED